MTFEDAEALLRQAHLDCEGQVLRSEYIEPELVVSEQDGTIYLSYWVEDGQNKAIVECVSRQLFGSDQTGREFSRDEWIEIENRFDWDSKDSDRRFDSRWLDSWNEPFGFVRAEYTLLSKSNMIFTWGYSPSE